MELEKSIKDKFLPYLEQDCNLTLKEGLEIHYSIDQTYRENVELVPAFYNHDIAHVIFGLSTKIEHESLVDTRIIFGTNWGFKKYIADYYNDSNANKIIMQIFKDIGYIRGIFLSLKSLPSVFNVIIDCMKMNHKWRLNPNEELMNTKLSVLRNKFNIKVIN